MASRLFEGSLLSWMFWALRVFALVVSSIRYLYLYLCVAAVNWPGDVAFERRKTRPTGLLDPVQQQPDGHRTAAPPSRDTDATHARFLPHLGPKKRYRRGSSVLRRLVSTLIGKRCHRKYSLYKQSLGANAQGLQGIFSIGP